MFINEYDYMFNDELLQKQFEKQMKNLQNIMPRQITIKEPIPHWLASSVVKGKYSESINNIINDEETVPFYKSEVFHWNKIADKIQITSINSFTKFLHKFDKLREQRLHDNYYKGRYNILWYAFWAEV